MTEVDQYANWRRRLAGERNVMTYADQPDSGYYRAPITERTPGGGFKKVGWHAVAFWRDDDGTLFCRVGDRIPLTGAQAIEWWHPVSNRPITEELYFDVVDHGKPWPDMPHEPPAQPAPQQASLGDDFAETSIAPGPGHNQPEQHDPLAAMREQIDSAVGAATGLPITTKAEADTAQAHRARLNELATNADNHRKVEKAPHQSKADEVDAKYMPLVKSAKAAADALRQRLSDFATAQAKAAREEVARMAAEKAKADEQARQRAQAEQDRVAAMAKGETPAPLPPAPPPTPAPTIAPVSTFKGASGKAAGATMVKFAVVENWAALAEHYSTNQRVRDLLQLLANQDAKAGNPHIPGCSIDERADVR